MPNVRQRKAINLSHNSVNVSPQVGMVNVGTVQPTVNFQINIARPRTTAESVPRDRGHESTSSPNEPAKKNLQRSPTAPTHIHGGNLPPPREKISGRWHTLVNPRPDGSFQVTYTKTRAVITLTPPPATEKASKTAENEGKTSFQEIDGYQLKFGGELEIIHPDIQRFRVVGDDKTPRLVGRQLEIYRPQLGREYFLLTNYFFMDITSAKDTVIPEVLSTELPDETEGKARSHRKGQESRHVTKPADRALEIELKHSGITVTKRTFYLDDPPVKLGDGSFGVVYQVRDLPGQAAVDSDVGHAVEANGPTPDEEERYALKIFYNRQMMTRTGLIRVEPATFNQLERKRSAQITQVQEISFVQLLEHVFRALERGSPMDAVKTQLWDILRQSERLQNVSAKRFGREREISRQIRAALGGPLGVNSNTIACVQTSYDTTQFRNSGMYRFLRDHEKKKGATAIGNLSNYAIVMELCDVTLEDVLEGHWRIWGQKADTGNAVHEPTHTDEVDSIGGGGRLMTYHAEPVVVGGKTESITGEDGIGRDERLARPPKYAQTVDGYGMLKCLTFTERTAIIHPIVKGLAEALQMLHATRNYHHDIKPGNVFIKKAIKQFYVSLGDFSFVGSGVDEGTTEAVLHDSIQTGSLYFRSPEQRDISDAAYGIVRHSECCDGPGDEYSNAIDGEDSGWAYVRILDPKFRRSTIGPDDIAVFPADRNGTGFRVLKVHTGDMHRDVWLNVDAKEFQGLFPEETRTKVFLYKIPTVRSDLFGLGAICFDLLTGGEPAERFYEVLRPFDVPSEAKTGERNVSGAMAGMLSASAVVEKFAEYRRNREVPGGPAEKAALLNVFEFFRDGNDFAPPEVVNIIVKLMGTNLADSYFNTDRRLRGVPEYLLNICEEALPVSWALEDIRAIAKQNIYDLGEQQPQQGMDNLLFRPQQSQEYLARVVDKLGATEVDAKEASIPEQTKNGRRSGRRDPWDIVNFLFRRRARQ